MHITEQYIQVLLYKTALCKWSDSAILGIMSADCMLHKHTQFQNAFRALTAPASDLHSDQLGLQMGHGEGHCCAVASCG